MSEKEIDADGEANSDQSLQEIFSKGWLKFEELEDSPLPFNSSEYQHKVKDTMSVFETTTTFVNKIGLFSPNELIDEVSTDSLQYLLLPFFLGKVALKLHQEDRGEVLHIAEVYFKDFLHRCEEYELCESRKTSSGNTDANNTNELAQLMRAAHARNDKIAQYRKKKELEEFVKKMKLAVRCKNVDDEVRRDFFLKLINKSIIEANEELDSIKLEKQMVEMRKMHVNNGASAPYDTTTSNATSETNSQHVGHLHHHNDQQPKRKPMQPFIITRNAAQKAVFGAGYPSLPVMTVDEFYDQRVREGVFPDEEKVAKMNREQALAAAQDPNEKEDQEKAIEEAQIENDDPEYLDRMRRMDEYKDVVRRGDGNRYNRS